VRSTIQEAPPRPSERRPELAIPPELDALCFAAIQRDPSERLPSARTLHDALERFLAGERDLELRGALAAQHVDAAQVHREAKDDAVAARRRAIRELGRALALDPGNDRATNDLLALLGEMPSETPEEVERLAAGARRRYWRIVARFSGLAYLSIFLYAPLLLWNGATALTTVVFFYLLITLAAALSFWVSRQEEPAIALVLVVHAVSNIAFATLGGLTGPLFVVPMVVTVNAGGFALLFGRRLRWWIFAGGALAIFVPLALELAGVLAPTYEFVDGAMIIRPRWVEARPLPSLVFLGVAALTSLGTATLLFSELREMVLRSERRFYVHAWQLRQLLPGRLR
jgi:serine/threonine-protein kinase